MGTSATWTDERTALARRGRRLEHFTIAWNSLEGLIAIGAGVIAGSISLVGFGVDSFIEVTSGAALLWRMSGDDEARREHREAITLRIVGSCFVALAAYVAYEAVNDLISGSPSRPSAVGIALAGVSLVVILLAGLVLNFLVGWWWADPIAAMIMTPLIIREGISALRGDTCCD